MTAPGGPTTESAVLTELYNLVVNPSQTSDQVSAGELNFQQVRSLVLQIQELVKGDGTPSRPGHDNVVIQLNALTTQVSEITKRIDKVETSVPPVLLKADEELKKLQAQAEDVKQVMSRELSNQESKQSDLIKHTGDKFQELEAKHAELIANARNKFDEMEQSQQDLLTGATTRFDELEQFRKNFEQQVATKINETDQQMHKVASVSIH